MQTGRYKYISTRSCVVLTVFFMSLTAAFKWRNAEMTRFSGGRDVAPLDGRCKGYSLDEAAALFDALGSDGRAFYAISELSLDILFPLVYGAWLVICLWLLWGRPWRFILAGVVAIACLADLVENGLIAYMALTYSDALQPMTYIANLATLVKCSFLAVAVVGLGVGLILKYVVPWCSK